MTKPIQQFEEAIYLRIDPRKSGEWCKAADVRENLDAACRAHCTCGRREREDPRACVACRIWYQMETVVIT